jgi:hypothetical protein
VNGILGEHPRVLEHDGADRSFAAPVGEFLVLLAGRPESIEGRGPAHIGICAPVQWRKGPDRSALFVCALRKWIGTEKLEGAGQRLAERRSLEGGPGARSFE